MVYNLEKGGENMLKDLREKHGLSQSKLEHLSGVSDKTISRIENGDRNVTLVTLERLADFFEVTIDQIIEIKKR